MLIKLTVQKDVLNGVKVQQVFAVEFLVQNQQCDSCQRSYTDHTWRAQVQARQKVDHKKTFYLLEQLILRHAAHEKCINVEQVPTGVDFFFGERSHALKFIDFVTGVVPARSKAAKQLISEDVHEAIKNYKFAYAVEVVPLCKDDLVVLPAKTAAQLGSLNPVCLVLRVSSHIYLLDPRTLQVAEMAAEKYWREPCRALMPSSQLTEFTVLDVTPVTVAPIAGKALRRQMHGRVRGSGGVDSAAGSRAGSRAGSVLGGSNVGGGLAGAKRGFGGQVVGRNGGGGDDDDDKASVAGASSVVGGSTFAGGFTGGVSLAGGSIHFNGAMSVATTVTGGPKGKLLLADVEVMRTRDMGVSDAKFLVRTHLGNVLRPGDACMGYDLSNAVYNDADAESSNTAAAGKGGRGRGAGSRSGRMVELPDIVLVRKVSNKHRMRDADDLLVGKPPAAASSSSSSGTTNAAGAATADGGAMAEDVAPTGRSKARLWKLRRLDEVLPVVHSDIVRRGDEEKAARDYEDFLQEIEGDSALRKGINLYKNQQAIEQGAAKAQLQRQRAGATAAAASAFSSSASVAATAKARVTFGGRSRHAAAAAAIAEAVEEGDDDDGDEDEDDDGEEGEEGDVGLEELLDELDIGREAHAAGIVGEGGEENGEDSVRASASAESSGAGGSWGGGEEGVGLFL